MSIYYSTYIFISTFWFLLLSYSLKTTREQDTNKTKEDKSMRNKIKNWLIRLFMRRGYIDIALLQRAKEKGIILIW